MSRPRNYALEEIFKGYGWSAYTLLQLQLTLRNPDHLGASRRASIRSHPFVTHIFRTALILARSALLSRSEHPPD